MCKTHADPTPLRCLCRHDIPSTWNIYTQALEKTPYWCKAIVASGAELSLGGKRWLDYMKVKPEDEYKMACESIDKLKELTGATPSGGLARARCACFSLLPILACPPGRRQQQQR